MPGLRKCSNLEDEARASVLDRCPGSHVARTFLDLSRPKPSILDSLPLFVAILAPPDDPEMRPPSIVAVLARKRSDLGLLTGEDSKWSEIQPDLTSRPWTDDYSSILIAIIAKFR
jgi:hypothetical protein